MPGRGRGVRLAAFPRMREAERTGARGRGLLALAASERRRLGPAAALALVQAAAALVAPALAGRFAAELFGSRDPRSVAAGAGALVGLFALHAALGALTPWLLDQAEARMARRLRARLHARLQRVPLPWLERRRSGELTGLFAVDVESAAGFAAQLPGGVLALGATAVGAFVLMARLDPYVAGAVALVALPVALLTRVLATPVSVRAGELAARHAELLGRIQEGLGSALLLRLCAAGPAESARLAEGEAHLLRARERHLRRRLLTAPANQLVAAVGSVALVSLAALRPGAPALGGGELVSLVLYALVGTRPLLGLGSLYVNGQQALASLRRVQGVLDAPVEAQGEARALPEPMRGHVELRGIHLVRGGRPVLCGVDLELAPGRLVALVGPNGVGKSSLLRLLVRLLEPDAGSLLLDGVPVEALAPEALRRRVVLVSQETQLLDRSVRENLLLGLEGAPEPALRQALRRAGALDFVQALPGGLECVVGEAGVRLSGGQRQRLALARALLREPRVLLLDEATSMFDVEGERDFLFENRAWLRERSVLLVTHRPESLRAADRVLALREGRLVELPAAGTRPPRLAARSFRPAPSGRVGRPSGA